MRVQGLVYRYDTRTAGDGVGGEEGTFCLCTLWCIEALARASTEDRQLLVEAVKMFEVRRISFLGMRNERLTIEPGFLAIS